MLWPARMLCTPQVSEQQTVCRGYTVILVSLAFVETFAEASSTHVWVLLATPGKTSGLASFLIFWQHACTLLQDAWQRLLAGWLISAVWAFLGHLLERPCCGVLLQRVGGGATL